MTGIESVFRIYVLQKLVPPLGSIVFMTDRDNRKVTFVGDLPALWLVNNKLCSRMRPTGSKQKASVVL